MKKTNPKVRAARALLNASGLRLFAGFAILLSVVAACQYGYVAGASILGLMAMPFAPAAQSVCLGAVDRHSLLKQMKARAKILQPSTAMRVEGVLNDLEESLKPENEAANAEKMRDLIQRSRAGDAEAKAEMAKIRVISVDNFLLATTNPIAYFDTVTLEDNEIPYIENTSRQEIVVSYLGQDGRARKTQPIRYQQFAQVDLHELSTEEYEYTLRDIYKGEVKSASMANVDMARDFELQVSKLLWPFIKAAIGNFNLVGNRQGRVFFPHSIVNVKNLPTTNLLVPAGNTTQTLWRKECMDVVLEYCAAWGNNAFGDGQLKPTAVYIPSSEVMGFLSQVQLTSFPNALVEEIFESGFVINYGGVKWTFIADATLDPDEGMAYVKFNKGIGSFFTKPGMDQTFEDETIGMKKQNKGSVSMSKVIGFGLPITARVNVAGVLYHTPR